MRPDEPSTPRHPVRSAALRTGLTPHTLRAWERRHHVVVPTRSEGGQRLYSDLDVERLRLLRRLTERGHSIGQIAAASLDDLQRIAREEDVAGSVAEESALGRRAEDFRIEAINAARRLDAGELQAILERAAVSLGVPQFLEQMAGPSLQRIGQGWSDGTVSIAQEHLATTVFRRVLGWILRLFEASGSAPRLIAATPPGQAHEFGAMIASAVAAAEGWDVTYLGADLPVADILSAAQQVEAHAVALSVVYPVDDPALFSELERLRKGLDRRVALLIGGTAASAHRQQLTSMGAEVMDSLAEFRTVLQRLQEP